MKKIASQSIEFGGQTLTLETGKLAERASASVLGRLGDTVVLVTVVEGGKSDLDYFPLSIEYIENLFSGGKIKGSRWVKRDGRPSDDAILAGRVIDRSIRPLFPKAFKNVVQIVINVLSVDGTNDPVIVALNAVSAAVAISRIPWNGPIGGMRMGYDEATGTYLVNPTTEQRETSLFEVIVSQVGNLTNMIEAEGRQVSEEIMATAIVKAHEATQKIIDGINEFVKAVGDEKLPLPTETSLTEFKQIIEKNYGSDVDHLIERRAEGDDSAADELAAKIFTDLKTEDPSREVDKKILAAALDYTMFKKIRSNILVKKMRPDGRKLDEIRPLSSEVGVLPRTHGSALFQRGMTQALSIATLGSPRMEQLIESAEGEEAKRYIHHYVGLPFSIGQAGRIGTPGRREIGHGALAEKALKAVIPSQDVFPYTIMVVSEVLSQNGSSSMASTCGSTLALMDAGVPILKPVAGISIGMMSDENSYELLTDIKDLEDFSGDMDFKVAGTDTGITAIQLDVKVPGLTDEQIGKILDRAKIGRMQVMEVMMKAINTPRASVSQYAPKIITIKVPQEKIGEIIGPGGRVIKNIIATTGADLDMSDDGTLSITGTTEDQINQAREWVEGLTHEVEVGEVYDSAEVKRILPFGAFVELVPGKEGMVHVSQMSNQFVRDPQEIVHIGDKVKVHVIEIDSQGRVNLSMLFNEDGSPMARKPQEPRERNFNEEGPRFNERPEGGYAPHKSHPLVDQFKREQGGQRPNRNRNFNRTRSY